MRYSKIQSESKYTEDIQIKVSSVEKTESAITVTIKRKTPDRGTDALKTWSFIVEMEKSDAGEVRYTII